MRADNVTSSSNGIVITLSQFGGEGTDSGEQKTTSAKKQAESSIVQVR
jgi:hypothetical protein